MTHHMVCAYDLHKSMEIYVRWIIFARLTFFHHENASLSAMLPATCDFIHRVSSPIAKYSLPSRSPHQRPRRAYGVELAQFHSEDYVEFLQRVTPDTQGVRAS